MSAISTLMWIVASLLALPPLGATAWIVTYAWTIAMAGMLFDRPELNYHAGTALVVATAKWLAFDTLYQRAFGTFASMQYMPLVNPSAAMGLLLAISIAAISGWRRIKSLRGAEPLAMLAVFVLAWTGTFE